MNSGARLAWDVLSSIGARQPSLGSIREEVWKETTSEVWAKVSYDGCADPHTELLIYQVAKEALRNAAKHSGATDIRLDLDCGSCAKIELRVTDNGRGFDISTVDSNEHFGLQLMAERVERAGGSFDISFAPGKGCELAATFPSGRAASAPGRLRAGMRNGGLTTRSNPRL